MLSNFVLPPWLNWKFALAWLVGVGLLALLYSWNERGHQVQRLADFQKGVVSAVSEATVDPDKTGKVVMLKPEQIVPAIHGLQSSYKEARTTLIYIDKENKKYKARADDLDKQLAQSLAHFKVEYALANKQITFLQHRPPVPEADVCRVIKEDTNSAWDGWKQ